MPVYQCYFSHAQRGHLFKHPPYIPFGLEPEVNPLITANCPELETFRNRMYLAEYGAMLHLWRNLSATNDGWIGFTSHRQTEKTSFLLHEKDVSYVHNLLDQYDVLGWLFLSFSQSILQQAECSHPGITGLMQRLLAQVGLNIPYGYSNDCTGLFANYWIMKWRNFDAFMKWSFPFIEYCIESQDRETYIFSHPRSIGFLMERLFIVWYEVFDMRMFNLSTHEPWMIAHSVDFLKRETST